MSSDEQLWTVRITDFAKSHYIKKFQKKYHGSWDVTEDAIVQELRRVDTLERESSRFAVVVGSIACGFGKLEFAVAGTKVSPKSSGCRAIVWCDAGPRQTAVLLVYSKNQIGPPNETAQWQEVIKTHYPDLWKSVADQAGQ